MNLRPLGDRVLIKPDLPPDVTDSGLILAEQRKPEETGTVVAVGLCPHPLKHEAEEIAKELEDRVGFEHAYSGEEWIQALPDVRAAVLLRQATHREPLVKPGDYVVFSWVSGQEITVEDERYLLMREADILCVVEGVTV